MLKEYLYNHLLDEKDIVLTLIDLDNSICHTHLVFEDLLNILKEDINLKPINTYNHFITNGEVKVVLNTLINYAPYILNLYIDNRFLAINSWFLKKFQDYYDELNIKLLINLDSDLNILKYKLINCIIVGDNVFIKNIKNELNNNNLMSIEIN